MTEEQRQLAIDFQNTFGSEHGKRTLNHIKILSGYDEGIDPKTVSAGMVMYFLGGREMYLMIKEQMDADTSELAQQSVAVTDEGVNKEGQQQEVAEDG
jgi:hypothetical protein